MFVCRTCGARFETTTGSVHHERTEPGHSCDKITQPLVEIADALDSARCCLVELRNDAKAAYGEWRDIQARIEQVARASLAVAELARVWPIMLEVCSGVANWPDVWVNDDDGRLEAGCWEETQGLAMRAVELTREEP